MSTHPHGDVYDGWRRAEDGLTALEKEIKAEQVRTIALSEYVPGHPHYEWLLQQVADYHRFRQPEDLSFNL